MFSSNSTSFSCSPAEDPLCLQSTYIPWYFTEKPEIIPGFKDEYLALAAPVVAYWTLSLFFHFLDTRTWRWLDNHRIHPSKEVASKNLVTRSAVVYAVILQHIIQTGLGIWWLATDEHKHVPHQLAVRGIARTVEGVFEFAGIRDPVLVLSVAELVYWWAIPAFQLFAAMYAALNNLLAVVPLTRRPRFIVDTWQYFLHRLMHVNKFLYRHLHSWHHRLYVPYAFGALYNHPLEGFLLDSLGTATAESLTRLSTRQAMVLFTLATFKTVDDHCGYNFPWDPLQWMSGNNANYHDIHHQVCTHLPPLSLLSRSIVLPSRPVARASPRPPPIEFDFDRCRLSLVFAYFGS